MKINLFVVLVIMSIITASAQFQTPPIRPSIEFRDVGDVQYKTIMISGLNIFYREAGDPSKTNNPSASRISIFITHVS